MKPSREPDVLERLPRLVLFDLGNVLISLRTIREAFGLPEKGARSGGDALDAKIAWFLRSEPVDRFERGLATPEEFFEFLRSTFEVQISPSELQARFERILGEEIPGMRELVRDLKRAGVRVAGLSDTNPVHLAVLKKYPIVGELEAVVASCETGYRKPNPEAYRAALRCVGLGPEEVFYTDDLPRNVEGAESVGIRAVLFRGPGDLRKVLRLPKSSPALG